MSISAVIITKDEEATIARCLRSLSFTDEQIVVDAESTDRTRDIASAAGARVLVNPWPGYGAQKNFAREQARGEWLLFIDADEEVTPDLQKEIMTAIAQPTPDFYWLRIVTVFLGKPLMHLYGHNPRLMRKQAGKWTDAKVHEQVERLSSKSAQALEQSSAEYRIIKLDDTFSQILPSPLLHHSHPTIRSYLKKMHHYTTLDAAQMAKTGQHRSGFQVRPHFLLPWHLSFRQFIKLYFYRRGLLDGWAGLMWSLLSSYYEFEMAQKYREKSAV